MFQRESPYGWEGMAAGARSKKLDDHILTAHRKERERERKRERK